MQGKASPAKAGHVLSGTKDGRHTVVAVVIPLPHAAEGHGPGLAENDLAIGPVGESGEQARVILWEHQYVVSRC